MSKVQIKIKERLRSFLPPTSRAFDNQMQSLSREQRKQFRLLQKDISQINNKVADADIVKRSEAMMQATANKLADQNSNLIEVISNTTNEIRLLKNDITTLNRKIANLESIIRMDVAFKDYEYYKNLKPCDYARALADWYEKRTDSKLDLTNPKTYNEKIQWMKLYDRTPIKTKLADKYEVREWVSDHIGDEYLIPLLGVWNSFDEINFDELPDQFVLKCTHGSSWNMVVTDKSALDYSLAKSNFDRWLSMNFAFYAGFELQYKDIQPRIVAEQYLENDGTNLNDTKFWCFNSKPEYVQCVADRSTGPRDAFFDPSWNRLPFITTHKRNPEEVPKPENLDKMLHIAEDLSQGFHFVRVDLYALNSGEIKFGEMTFTPTSGVCKWDPPEYNLIVGQRITLPNRSAI